MRGVDGSTAQSHVNGAVVEDIFDADTWNDLIDQILVQHNQDGTHKKVTGMDNNVPITQKNAAGTAKDVIGITSADYLALGHADLAGLILKTGGDGWIFANETWTYASATTFTISGDLTGKYQKGDKIKLTQTTVKYFYITAISYGAPNTTITVTGGTDYTLANAAITLNFFSKVANPQGFPDWFSYTPTYTGSGSLTYGTVTTTYARFRVSGKQVFVEISATGTTGGVDSFGIRFSLPINAANLGGTFDAKGVGANSGPAQLWWHAQAAGVAEVVKYDGSNWGLGAAREINCVGQYEMA